MNELRHIRPLDGLRAIAILMVLVWHYLTNALDPTLFGGSARIFQKLTSMTWSGVDLFFVLSGFLIGRVLIAHRGSANYFSAFYVRRALRIFPAYYLVLALVGVLSVLPMAADLPWLMDGLKPAWTYVTYLQNFFMRDGFGGNALGVTWSLALEEQFYLLLPLIIWLVRPTWLPALLIAGIALAPLVRAGLATQDAYSAYVLLPGRMDALLAGALVAWMSLRGAFEARSGRVASMIALSIGGGVLLALFTRFGLGQGLGGVWLHSALALVYSGLLAAVLYWQHTSFAQQWLAWRPLRELAKISYMVYLTHQIFSGLAHGLILQQSPQLHGLADAMVTALALAATLVFSSLSFRWFESPLTRLGGRWQYRATSYATPAG